MRIAALVAIGVAAAIGFTLYDVRDEFPTFPQICAHLPSPLTPARYADRVTLGQCPWEASFGFRKSFSGTFVSGLEVSSFCPDEASMDWTKCKWLSVDSQASRDFPSLSEHLDNPAGGYAKFRVRFSGWESLWPGHHGYRGAYAGHVLVDRFEAVEPIALPSAQ
jgi:hypothetical protein